MQPGRETSADRPQEGQSPGIRTPATQAAAAVQAKTQSPAALAALKEFRERPIQEIDKPLKVVTSIYLVNPWPAPLCSLQAATVRSLCCYRCDIVQQRRLLAGRQGNMSPWDQPVGWHDEDREAASSEWVTLALIILVDVLTLGTPCGWGYSGMATAGYGCWTRWLVRRHYRIDDYGWIDLAVMSLCPGCGVSQQRESMAADGIVAPSPLELR